METISKRLKDILRTTMQDEETYSNEAIRQLIYVKSGMKYDEDYKETHFAGCLNALKKSGEIIQVQRGLYRKGKPLTCSGKETVGDTKLQNTPHLERDQAMSIAQVKGEIVHSVQKELTFLKSVTQNIIMSFETPEEDIQFMLNLKEVVKSLEDFERKIDL